MAGRPPKQRKAPAECRLVYVKWIDSSHQSGWTPRDEHKPLSVEDMVCETVGFLFHESEHAVEIVQSLSTSEEYDCIMTIPKVVVQDFYDLTRAPTKRRTRAA